MENKKLEKENVVIFEDNLGRLVIGETVEENESVVAIRNPAIVQADQDQQTKQMGFRLIPTAYVELFDDIGEGVWAYSKITNKFNNKVITDDMFNFYTSTIQKYLELKQQFDDRVAEESVNKVVNMVD